MRPNFYLGVGAQKSGTTWLHAYLSQFPNFDFGLMKDYHVWDALYVPDCRSFRITDAEQLVWTDSSGRVNPSTAAFLRYNMQRQAGAYEHYFCTLAKDGVDSTGDLTPDYACLDASVLGQVRSSLEGVGFDVRVVFVMRDPVQRCLSAARMYKRLGWASGSDADVLQSYYRTRTFSTRTDYAATLTTIDEVFAPDEVHCAIYEELFTPSGLEGLSEFCGVENNEDWLATRVNAATVTEAIPERLRAQVADHYADVYAFCQERFPQTHSLWLA